MRKIIKRIILTILFLGILGGCILFLNHKFTYSNRSTITEEFFIYSEGQIDVIFAGPSTTMQDIYPMTLWEEYGITSYNLGASNQSLAESYYVIKAAIEQVHPKLVVVDGGTVNDGQRVRSLSTIHRITDNMPVFLKTRLEMILDLGDSDLLELFFPLDVYHSKWKDPSDTDISGTEYQKVSSLGTYVNFQANYSEPYEDKAIDTSYEMHGWIQIYLEKIEELCEETGTELLYVTYPTFGNGTYITENNYNVRRKAALALSKWARSHGQTHLNLFANCEELGFDRETDSIDGHHMNYWGGQKVTKLVGDYITAVYELEDHRGDAEYQFMADLETEYDHYILKRGLNTTQNLTSYLSLLETYATEERYSIFFSLGGSSGRTFTAEEVRGLYALGLEQNLQKYGKYSYAAVISGGEVLYESDVRSLSLEESRTEVIDGKTCVVFSSYNGTVKASVEIAGTNYAVNHNGLNIVVYDNQEEELVDAVAFELNAGGEKYYR